MSREDQVCGIYVGVSCVDGSCPIALADEYAECGMDVIRECKDCSSYKGCEDCALRGTEYCDGEGKECSDYVKF